MAKKERSLKSKLISALGRVWMTWGPRNEVKRRCKVEGKTGWFRCEICKQEREKLEVDHREPVVPIADGFTDWNQYIASKFVQADKLQGLCRDCHVEKTKKENVARKLAKRNK